MLPRVIFRLKEFEKQDVLQVKQVNAGCKCSWSWAWLRLETTTDINEETHNFSLSHFIKNLDKEGHPRYSHCMKDINYANKGSQSNGSLKTDYIYQESIEDLLIMI